MNHADLCAELAHLLTDAGITQYRLEQAGVSSVAARRVLGRIPGLPEAESIDRAARLVGLELRLAPVALAPAAPKDAPATGSTKPGIGGKSLALRSTNEAAIGSGPLTRKPKGSSATFLPGELEPVTTGAVTRKRKGR